MSSLLSWPPLLSFPSLAILDEDDLESISFVASLGVSGKSLLFAKLPPTTAHATDLATPAFPITDFSNLAQASKSLPILRHFNDEW